MGYRLKVFDAYRPQTAVTQFMRWAQEADDTRMQAYFYPETEKSALFRRATSPSVPVTAAAARSI